MISQFFKQIENNFYFLKYVYKFSKSYVIVESIVALLRGIAPLIWVILPKIIIDEVMYGKDFSKILYYILIFFIIELSLNIGMSYLNETYINLNKHLYSINFLLTLNKKMIELDMKQLDDPDVHQKIALVKDIIYRGIGIRLIDNFFSFITSVITIISVGSVVLSTDIKLFFIILGVAIFSVWLNLISENWEISQRDENMYLSRILNYYIDIMGNKSSSKEMKMFSFSDWVMKKYYNTLQKLRARLHILYKKIFKIYSATILFETIKNSGIYLYLAYLTFKKVITVGQFTQCFTATGELSQSIVTSASFFTNLNINGKYIQSFREFMEMKSEIQVDDMQNRNFCQIPNKVEKITFENVYFKYTNMSSNVLENINYTFEKGKIYVIVGENGAGKTTLVNLLTRLYDPDGNIYLNGTNIKEYNILEYRKKFSVVFQDFKYFAFTIGENVALNEDIEQQEIKNKIMKYIKESGFEEKLSKLPQGIDTELDKIFHKDGVILSGGESQKLALARALFRESEILILDEPSSALDPLAEDELLMRFKEITKDKLVIYISHRLSCVTMADEILYIKDEKIKEAGSHKQLIEKNGEYAKFYYSQAKHYK